ncbi:hypothetical protein D9M68_832760 [compost metagenome]
MATVGLRQRPQPGKQLLAEYKRLCRPAGMQNPQVFTFVEVLTDKVAQDRMHAELGIKHHHTANRILLFQIL